MDAMAGWVGDTGVLWIAVIATGFGMRATRPRSAALLAFHKLLTVAGTALVVATVQRGEGLARFGALESVVGAAAVLPWSRRWAAAPS